MHTSVSTYVNEPLKQEGRVHGPARRFRVELHGRPRLGLVDHALVRVVVGVAEQRLPAVGKRFWIHGEPVKARFTYFVVHTARTLANQHVQTTEVR